jgi:hypothetical protein
MPCTPTPWGSCYSQPSGHERAGQAAEDRAGDLCQQTTGEARSAALDEAETVHTRRPGGATKGQGTGRRAVEGGLALRACVSSRIGERAGIDERAGILHAATLECHSAVL